MSFAPTPGNVFGCTINAHRSGWSGSICEEAKSWNCNADQSFREDYCSAQIPRCFHLHVFDPLDTHLVIPHSGVGWIADRNPDTLRDQILGLWGFQFQEPHGIRPGHPREWQVYGLYRIQRLERADHPHLKTYRVEPYPDGWVNLSSLGLARPSFRATGGPYIKEVEQRTVKRLLTEAEAAAEDRWTDESDSESLRRLKLFTKHFDGWCANAKEGIQRHAVTPDYTTSVIPRSETARVGRHRPFANEEMLESLKARVRQESAASLAARTSESTGTPVGPAAAVASPPTEALPQPTTPSVRIEGPPLEPLVERSCHERIAKDFGDEVLAALLVGSLTKPIVALRGDPGVGKSTLALGMLDDPKRDRSLVIPVASTWRGRDDLLGYVNPIDGEFEPQPFTDFVFAAGEAYERGDVRHRLVIFEEFNLSQPEYWLSDVLVRSQYASSAKSERMIHLGGTRVKGREDGRTSLWLPPNLRFVATLNTDHTTRALSPRVLDRMAIIEIELEPRRALERAKLELEEELATAITELCNTLSRKQVGFSIRAAMSLKSCFDRMDGLGLTREQALDLVLVQEVLTKVRLLAADPADHAVQKSLSEWVTSYADNLPRTSARIYAWGEALGDGLDVDQA